MNIKYLQQFLLEGDIITLGFEAEKFYFIDKTAIAENTFDLRLRDIKKNTAQLSLDLSGRESIAKIISVDAEVNNEILTDKLIIQTLIQTINAGREQLLLTWDDKITATNFINSLKRMAGKNIQDPNNIRLNLSLEHWVSTGTNDLIFKILKIKSDTVANWKNKNCIPECNMQIVDAGLYKQAPYVLYRNDIMSQFYFYILSSNEPELIEIKNTKQNAFFVKPETRKEHDRIEVYSLILTQIFLNLLKKGIRIISNSFSRPVSENFIATLQQFGFGVKEYSQVVQVNYKVDQNIQSLNSLTENLK